MSVATAEPMIIGHQRPRLSFLPDAYSYAAGEDAVEFAAKSGMVLDDWQSWALTQSMATDKIGKWAAFEVCWIIPRQNGKNEGLLARQLAGLYILGESLQIHTAHEFKASSEHFLKIQAIIKSNPELYKRVKPNGIRTSHGEEAIELRPKPTLIFGPGSRQISKSVAPRLRFLARSRGSGRSFTADAVYYDEAMILSDEEVSASMPTMSAVANAQMWYTASAGMPDSIQLGAVRDRGIKGSDPSLVFLEWSCEFCPELCPHLKLHRCPDHDRRDDPRSWARANPGMNIRISEVHIGREHNKMPAAGFDRERLGIGDWPVGDEAWAVIPEHKWNACAWPEGEMPRPDRIAVSVDITPDQSAATIAIAGLLRDTADVKDEATGKIIKTRLCAVEIGNDGEWDDHRSGTAWIIPRLREIVSRQKVIAIVIDPVGPGAELITEIENDKVLGTHGKKATRELLQTCQLRDVAQAHAQFLRGVEDKTMCHRGQGDLRQAVAAGVQRDVGDGQHAWARKDTTQDISPLCAATMAEWAARKFGRGYDLLNSVR